MVVQKFLLSLFFVIFIIIYGNQPQARKKFVFIRYKNQSRHLNSMTQEKWAIEPFGFRNK